MCCSVLPQSCLKEQKIVLKMNITASYWLTGSALQKKNMGNWILLQKEMKERNQMRTSCEQKERLSYFPEIINFYKQWEGKQNKTHSRILWLFPFKCPRYCYNLDYDLKHSCRSRCPSHSGLTVLNHSSKGRVLKMQGDHWKSGHWTHFLFLCIFSSQKRNSLIHHFDRSPQDIHLFSSKHDPMSSDPYLRSFNA